MASKAELGKYPVLMDINKKIHNYLSHLQDKDDNSIIKQSPQISKRKVWCCVDGRLINKTELGLSNENLIPQLLNSNDYYVNLRLIMFISSCFEMRDIVLTLFGILDKCYNCTLQHCHLFP